MVKVLQFTIAETMAGRTQYIINLWKYIDKTKIRFDFITFSKNLDFIDEINLEGGRVFQIHSYPEADKDGFIKEFNQILDLGYDIIEVHTSYWKDTIVEKIARKRDLKVIVHSHSSGVNASLDRDQMQEALCRHYNIRKQLNIDLADAYWACSKESAQWLYGSNIPANRVELINSTIDSGRFYYHEDVRKQVRTQLALENYFVIGHVGRLEPVKNQIFILNMIKRVKKYRAVKCLMIGAGSLEEDLNRQAKTLGIENDVIFMGRRKDTEKLYQAMDYFLLPSVFEGFPLVILEAVCSGLRGICSTNVTEDVVLTEGIKRIPLDKPEEWEAQILKDSMGYQRENGADIILSKGYDTRTSIKKLEKRYEEIQSLAGGI